MQATEIVRRDTAERRRDTLARLGSEHDMWMSTARNVREEPRVRLALPDAYDVVLLQGEVECRPAREAPKDAADAFAGRFGWDPRAEEAPFLYLRVAPRTVRAWRGVPELRGRVVMREGVWLEQQGFEPRCGPGGTGGIGHRALGRDELVLPAVPGQELAAGLAGRAGLAPQPDAS